MHVPRHREYRLSNKFSFARDGEENRTRLISMHSTLKYFNIPAQPNKVGIIFNKASITLAKS